MPNARGKIPGFREAAGTMLSRSDILGGQTPVALGPRVLTGGNPGLDSVNALASYTPPTDWPPVGSLLRMPQVVWIQYGQANQYYTPDVIANSIQPAVAAAIAQITSIRPNRTWVYQQMPGYSIAIGGTSPTGPQLAYTPIVPIPSPGSIPAPAGTSLPADVYVGCDFLNLFADGISYSMMSTIPPGGGYPIGTGSGSIWFSVPSVSVSVGSDNITPEYKRAIDVDEGYWANGYAGGTAALGVFEPGGSSLCSQFTDNHETSILYSSYPGWKPPVNAALATLRKNYARFSGYSCFLFTQNLAPLCVADGSMQTTDAISFRGNLIVPDPTYMLATRYEQMVSDAYSSIARDNSDIGFSVAGDISQWVDSTYLVNLIAKHFNFDPTTGVDLPRA